MFQVGAYGWDIDKAEVDFTHNVAGNPHTYFHMEFENVSLTSLAMSGDSTSRPTFNGSFAYNSILMRYYYLNADGSPAVLPRPPMISEQEEAASLPNWLEFTRSECRDLRLFPFLLPFCFWAPVCWA